MIAMQTLPSSGHNVGMCHNLKTNPCIRYIKRQTKLIQHNYAQIKTQYMYILLSSS